MGRQRNRWGACESSPGAYASRVWMGTFAILTLLLMTSSVRAMPGGDDDAGRSSWANDVRGITPFKAVDREVQLVRDILQQELWLL